MIDTGVKLSIVRNLRERGVTLLELMIAITLVAGLSTGMLMAMRTSLLTYEKTAKKLESNRRFVKTQQILSNQIAAVIPVQGACAGSEGQTVAGISFLSGLPDALRLVTSYSIAEGARGYPQIVEYRVLPGERGSVGPIFRSRDTMTCCRPAPAFVPRRTSRPRSRRALLSAGCGLRARRLAIR